MKKGYLLAAVVFAVMLTLVLAGCPKPPAPESPKGPMPGMMQNMMKGAPVVNAEAPTTEAPAVEEEAAPAENAEAEAEIPAPTS